MYFFNYSTMVDPLLKDLRIYITELSGAKTGLKILDVCCGTGDQVFYYAAKGAAATGIDGNADMLKAAGRYKEKRGALAVDFHLADAAGLPFDDGHFDCASISLCLHEMEREKRDNTIVEMKRVVKDGGSLILTDFKAPLPRNPIGYSLRVAEYLVGTGNYRCFKDYISHGGLDSILEENRLTKQTEAFFISNCLHVLKTKNS